MKATYACKAAVSGLRGFIPVVSSIIELIFGTMLLFQFVFFESQSRVFIGVTLFFFFGLTIVRINRTSLFNDLMIDKWGGERVKGWKLREMRKGRAYRRCGEMLWGFGATKEYCRDSILYDVTQWQKAEFQKAMAERLARSKSSKFKKVLKKQSDLLESVYWFCENIGLSVIVMYFSSSISLGNFNLLEKRLYSICGATTMIAHYLFMEGQWNTFIHQYFELVELGQKAEKESALHRAKATFKDPGTLWEGNAGVEIELRDVSFAYPTRSPSGLDNDYPNISPVAELQFALKNFSFKFERGKIYSVVGQNGAGKTTLVQLLSLLYTPTSGSIAINGSNVLDYDPKAIRACMSVLFQDFTHYDFLSARESIEIGNLYSPTKHTKAESLASETGVSDFVSPDTVLQSLASKSRDTDETWQSDLSGGQWQKIGLARSFMRDDAGILILDEPTSALDVEAEHSFFKQILLRRKGKTTIFITHKFNTTKSADCIVYIKDGRVWEWGSHEELLRLNGEYARLYRIQGEGYDRIND
jgi:ABC-type multidrug transport system fused ATPase/permease subunit